MAQPTQYQYTPIQGPVWTEPIAEKLAWLPRGQQPARGLPPNRLGDFQQPPFESLFKPEGLQWLSSDRYAGKALPFSVTRYYTLDPIPPANPRLLDWQPRDRYKGRGLDRALLDWSIYPLQPIATPYDPQNLEWQARDSYSGKLLGRGALDFSVYPLQPPQGYDPQNLEWIPQGLYPRVPVELRRVGDFVQPQFSALYDPSKIEWALQGQYPQRTISFIYSGVYVTDPIPHPNVAPPNLHRIYYDVSSGRLFIRISVTANPTLIEPL